MPDQALHEVEWHNPANWSGPRFLGLYFSKRDPRLWVPKRIPLLGWTINLGHPRGPLCMLSIFGGIVLLVIGISIATLALAS